MSLREQRLVTGLPSVIMKGKSNTPTEASLDVGMENGVVTVSQIARKPAAHDTEISSRLTVDEAKEVRDKLSEMIERAEAYE